MTINVSEMIEKLIEICQTPTEYKTTIVCSFSSFFSRNYVLNTFLKNFLCKNNSYIVKYDSFNNLSIQYKNKFFIYFKHKDDQYLDGLNPKYVFIQSYYESTLTKFNSYLIYKSNYVKDSQIFYFTE